MDDIFVIMDSSLKSRNNVERIRRIAQEIGIEFKNLYLVVNHRFTEALVEQVKGSKETYLGKIEYDSSAEEYNFQGRSLLNVPKDSPAYLSVQRILNKAGYKTCPSSSSTT